MSSASQEQQEFERLLAKVVDASLEPSDADRLEELIKGNPERLRLYLNYMEIDVLLESETAVSSSEGFSALDATVSSEAAPQTAKSARTPESFFSKLQWGRLSLAALVLVSVAMGWYILAGSTQNFAATVVRVVDPVWNSGETAIEVRSTVEAGQLIKLDSGLVEFRMQSGASVVLAGPSELVVADTNSVNLNVGKLAARVPGEAIGFAVHTPVTHVVDLGTAFGVDVDSPGATDIAVFEGAVEASVASNGTEGSISNTVLIRAGSVGRIGTDHKLDGKLAGLKGSPIARKFEQLLGRRLSVADMIAGGDGTGDASGRGIDPTTGRFVEVETIDTLYERNGPTFHLVDESPWIAGVFIPGGERGEVVIDPTGRRFASRRLSGDESFGPFWVGATAPVRTIAGLQGENRMLTELDGVDYGTPSHSVVFCHANKGITFDLQAIRKAYPSMNIQRFSALLGNTENSNETRPNDRREAFMAADFWVLLDGKTKYQRLNFNRESGIESVDVPISRNARYLTLISGNGPAKTILDWVILVDATVHLESKI